LPAPDPDTLARDFETLAQAVRQAGALALTYFGKTLEIKEKTGNQGPVTNADLAVNALLCEALLGARPDYGWLSEESPDGPERQSKSHVWIIDPIDGTRGFIKAKPDFTISAALAISGQIVLSVIYAPAHEAFYSAALGAGAQLNGATMKSALTVNLDEARVLGAKSLYRHANWREAWPEMVIENRPSIAYRMALVASGAYDLTISLGRTHEWDIAAGALLLSEAGAHVSDHLGRPLTFNRPIPSLPSMLACASGLADDVLKRTASIKLPG
jgi:myo-inositol-1(or 4)-monophosphatase